MTAGIQRTFGAIIPVIVLAVGLLIGRSDTATAQTTVRSQAANPDTVRTAHACARAARVVEEGKPARGQEQAWARITTCGARASAAVQQAWLAQRTVHDTVQLSATFYQLWSFRDRMLFDAALEVARDSEAAPPSRVFSFMMLLAQLSDRRYPAYGSFSATSDYDVCRLSSVFGRVVEVGTPLPADARNRAWTLARTAQGQSSNPAEVRSAARCVDQALYRDSVAHAGLRPAPPGRER